MQTFLPYPNFQMSAEVLDFRRLGKQRLETKQILSALTSVDNGLMSSRSGWKNHPATKMWAGHEKCLAAYGLTMCIEFITRGYNDNMRHEFMNVFRNLPDSTRSFPPWFGNADFHASHRSNLLRKDPHHYHQFGWTESTTLPYIWPV